jgi:hypothetical protein
MKMAKIDRAIMTIKITEHITTIVMGIKKIPDPMVFSVEKDLA